MDENLYSSSIYILRMVAVFCFVLLRFLRTIVDNVEPGCVASHHIARSKGINVHNSSSTRTAVRSFSTVFFFFALRTVAPGHKPANANAPEEARVLRDREVRKAAEAEAVLIAGVVFIV